MASLFEDYLHSDFELRLNLPKKEFHPGELISFEVEVSNPHGVPVEYLNLILKQTMVALVKGSFKVEQHQIADVVNGPGFSALCWPYFLQIPRFAQPSVIRSPSQVMQNSSRRSGGKEVIEIRYHLQVIATQCESFNLKSEEYPIKIVTKPQHPGGIQEVAHASSATISDVPIHGPMSESSRERNRRQMRRRNTLPAFTELLQENVPTIGSLLHPLSAEGQRRRGESISPPPRYSMLSLLTPFNGSVETLPPSYEDA